MTKTLRIVISLLVLAACTSLPAIVPPPPVQSDWDRTLSNARRNVADGNYFAADKILDEFLRTHPGTPEAREIAFWKAAYLVDPANERGSLPGGIAALDTYLATVARDGFVVTSANDQIRDFIEEPGYYVNVAHSSDYVRRVWGEYFDVVDVVPGMVATHDLAVLRKR